MERLTEYIEEGNAIVRMDLRHNGYQRCLNRLAEYEDLGVTPEQLKRIDGMYADRCREIVELKKRLESVSKEKVEPKYCKTCKETGQK